MFKEFDFKNIFKAKDIWRPKVLKPLELPSIFIYDKSQANTTIKAKFNNILQRMLTHPGGG
jgi:hypothetical protein